MAAHLSASDFYDVQTEVFRRMTGLRRPGTDAPAASMESVDYAKEAYDAWELWRWRYSKAVYLTFRVVTEKLKSEETNA